MTLFGRLTGKTICAAIFVGLLQCGAAMAEERKIYKHVDEKGNVVYSQVPPTTGANVKKLDTQPAYRGRGGNVMSGSPHNDPRVTSQDYRQDQYNQALQQRQKQTEEQRNKRLAELEAECHRDRGTDCSNPEVLRYNESTKIPGRNRP